MQPFLLLGTLLPRFPMIGEASKRHIILLINIVCVCYLLQIGFSFSFSPASSHPCLISMQLLESFIVALVDRNSLLTSSAYASQCLHNSQPSIKSSGLCMMTLSQITSHTLSLDVEVILLVFESYEVLKKPSFLFQMSESAHGV